MICSHSGCEIELQALVVDGLKLRCPGCNGVLLELDSLVTPEQLALLMPIVGRALTDDAFFNELLAKPRETLINEGISSDAVDALIDGIPPGLWPIDVLT